MGIGEAPKIFVIFLAAFLACVISTFQGVVDVDRTLINAARVLGAKDAAHLRSGSWCPASTPFILVGMRVGLGSAWAHPGRRRADRRPGGPGLPDAERAALLRPADDLRRPDLDRRSSACSWTGCCCSPNASSPAGRSADDTTPRSPSGTSRKTFAAGQGHASSRSTGCRWTSPTTSSSPSSGRPGCGKSTLMNILAGLEAADRRQALVDGVPVVRARARTAASSSSSTRCSRG